MPSPPTHALRASELFRGLTDDALAALAAHCEPVRLRGRSVLFREGDPADGLYVVSRGRLRAWREERGATRILGDIGPGGFVGEIALLVRGARTATVAAVRDGQALRFSTAAFEQIALSHPSVALALARTVAERALVAGRRGAAAPFRTLAVVALTPAASAREAAQGLAAALSRFGRAEVVRAAGVSAEWVEQLEFQRDFVLLTAEADEPAGCEFALRESDLVLEVAAGEPPAGLAPPAPDPLVRRELLLVVGEHPLHAAAWLDACAPDAHHRVAAGSDRDFASAARRLSGRAIGLALSGGGGRTVASLGVLRALQELQVPVDAVAGTSGGALIGGLAALQLPWREAVERVEGFGRAPLGRDLGPPLMSVMSGRQLSRALQRVFGEVRLEDLPRPLQAVCSDLDSGEDHVPVRGPVWLAVRASTSVPGVWPPVPLDGRLLVDGGLIDNLPAGRLVAVAAHGSIVCADVSRQPRFAAGAVALDESGWRQAARKLLRRGGAAAGPALGDILVQAITLSSARALGRARTLADCWLEPFEEGSDGSVAALAEAGYRRAMPALESWLARRPETIV